MSLRDHLDDGATIIIITTHIITITMIITIMTIILIRDHLDDGATNPLWAMRGYTQDDNHDDYNNKLWAINKTFFNIV